MNKFSKFCNNTLKNFYEKRMDESMKDSIEAEQNGHPAISFAMYQRYLNWKSKWEKCCKKQ